ncbi:hypothetical protein ILUMI_21679 [Ignelater luminosus]|uniref:Natterin-3 n=1 Tax=Ignelater luminosus TaxID=2038154 RepID=A0A8K0FXS9_IGNLU|nr:hypothetical protein ILUMI_21679 [Ignelater luminosus]
MSGYSWVPSSFGRALPPNAVQGGRDSDGSIIYVGKTRYMGDELPCKVIPQKRAAYVSHNCREHQVSSFEVLCQQTLRWVRNSGGYIPPGAVPGGRTNTGETLYIGRVHHGGSETVGKVHPSHGCLYIPYGGNEVSYKQYDILVLQ